MAKEGSVLGVSGRIAKAVTAVNKARPATMNALARASGPYPGVSFRSTLLRANQRYVPLSSSASSSVKQLEPQGLAAPGNSGRSLVPEVLAAGDTLGRTTIGKTGNAIASPPRLRPSATELPASTTIGASARTGETGAKGKPMAISEFPRPEGDNGRGMHWVPTTHSPTHVVDRFVQEAREMKVKWMVILNEDARIGDNDYLVKQLVANGIMPIMRIYTPHGRPIQGDVGAMVKHYGAMGVRYYQLYNEPNLNVENPDGVPNVDKYLDSWIPAAKAVAEAGGLPGLGALAPGGNFDDIEFFKQTLDKIKQRGEVASLDKAWLSMHNYTLNHPLDYAKDSNGFMKFKWYDGIIREKLGRQMPVIGTEGGTHIGSADDKTFPPIDEGRQLEMVTGAYRYMKNREPYNFAYTYWIIANEEGGGRDTAFSHQALFKRDGQSPLVSALKKLD